MEIVAGSATGPVSTGRALSLWRIRLVGGGVVEVDDVVVHTLIGLESPFDQIHVAGDE